MIYLASTSILKLEETNKKFQDCLVYKSVDDRSTYMLIYLTRIDKNKNKE